MLLHCEAFAILELKLQCLGIWTSSLGDRETQDFNPDIDFTFAFYSIEDETL